MKRTTLATFFALASACGFASRAAAGPRIAADAGVFFPGGSAETSGEPTVSGNLGFHWLLARPALAIGVAAGIERYHSSSPVYTTIFDPGTHTRIGTVAASAEYYVNPWTENTRGYFGLDVGYAQMVLQLPSADMTRTGVLTSPNAGLRVNLTHKLDLDLNVRYDWIVPVGEDQPNGIHDTISGFQGRMGLSLAF